jgi:hypothetical protein
MEAKHKQELVDLGAQHTIASEAASAEVGVLCVIASDAGSRLCDVVGTWADSSA